MKEVLFCLVGGELVLGVFWEGVLPVFVLYSLSYLRGSTTAILLLYHRCPRTTKKAGFLSPSSPGPSSRDVMFLLQHLPRLVCFPQVLYGFVLVAHFHFSLFLSRFPLSVGG